MFILSHPKASQNRVHPDKQVSHSLQILTMNVQKSNSQSRNIIYRVLLSVSFILLCLYTKNLSLFDYHGNKARENNQIVVIF